MQNKITVSRKKYNFPELTCSIRTNISFRYTYIYMVGGDTKYIWSIEKSKN